MTPPRRRHAILAVTVMGLSIASVALASHFSEEANRYFQRVCTKSKQEGIQAFVCDLRERLDALTVRVDNIPAGPQGPQGEVGPQGSQGEPGVPGSETPRLLVKDIDNKTVGVIMDTVDSHHDQRNLASYVLWNSDLQTFLQINLFGGLVSANWSGSIFFYESSDCSGPALLQNVYPYRLYASGPPGWDNFKVATPLELKRNIAVQSRWEGDCQPTNQTLDTAMEVVKVSLPSFSTPTGTPLIITEE